MRVSLRSLLLLTAAATLVVTACGSDQQAADTDSADSPSAGWSAGTVPTPEQLASVLVTADDLQGEWTTWEGPDQSPTGVPGVVPEEQRGNLPRMEFCQKASAESVQAAEQLEWTAFRQLNLTTPDAPRDHQVFVQQFLMAMEPADAAATYDALKAGIKACAGARTEYPDGEVGTVKVLTVPALGDQSVATREIVREPSPRGAAIWDLRNVFVQDGPVLMSIQLGEVTVGPDVEALLDRGTIDDIVTVIDQQLP